MDEKIEIVPKIDKAVRENILENARRGVSAYDITVGLNERLALELRVADVEQVIEERLSHAQQAQDIDLLRLDESINQTYRRAVETGDNRAALALAKMAESRAKLVQLDLFGGDAPLQTDDRQIYSGRKSDFFNEYINMWPNGKDIDELMAAGWDWRKAAYIVWRSTGPEYRVPAKLFDLCEMLGVTGRYIHRIKKKHGPAIDRAIAEIVAKRWDRMDPARLDDIFEAMLETAAMRGTQGTADRRMILEYLERANNQRKAEQERRVQVVLPAQDKLAE